MSALSSFLLFLYPEKLKFRVCFQCFLLYQFRVVADFGNRGRAFLDACGDILNQVVDVGEGVSLFGDGMLHMVDIRLRFLRAAGDVDE